MAKLVETALVATNKGKGKIKGKKGDQKCQYCDKKGHIQVKCFTQLKDIEEGRKYALEHPKSQKAKTRPLLTPGAKGNLLLVEKA